MKEETMALNTAIRHLTRGDWQKAHAIVQNDESDLGYWAHGIVHMVEGDIGNARYWYRRAQQPEATGALDAEWQQIVTALLDANAAARSRRQAGG